MKVRSGFVSNSSSASFIITMKTTLSDSEISEYIKLSDEHLTKLWDGGEVFQWDFDAIAGSGKGIGQWPTKVVNVDPMKNKILKRINSDTIEYHCSTHMFNDWMDIHGWKFVRAVNESRFNNIKIEKIIQTEEEYDDLNKEVDFDSKSWADDIEINNKNDAEYIDYLIRAGYEPSEEELVKFAKNQLNH